jgi:hypothetical protein
MSDDITSFNTIFNLADRRNQMIYDVGTLIHKDEWVDAGVFYASYVRKTKDPNFQNPANVDQVKEIITQLLHWCLNNDRYPLAARLLWTENQFDSRPHFTQLIWKELRDSTAMMLMGSASASKSYSTGVWLLLDWVRDPEYTCIKLLGPSEQHLNANLFTHMINLHQQASIPLPGITGNLYIGMNRKDQFGSISGVVVPLGKKSAGRLQGSKAGNKKRKKAHPVFGILGRLRVFMDESEKIPEGIWKDVDNIFSNLSGVETFKIICAYNPENQNGPSGSRSEPPDGWAQFNIDTDEVWTSRRGWRVVRLDGFKGENVRLKRVVFPGLQTFEGITALIANAGGYDSPGYYTMARAAFPPSSKKLVIIPQGMFDKAKGTFTFVGPTIAVAGVDLALEGGDAAKFAWGDHGLASGFRTPPSLKYPQGQYTQFTDRDGNSILRPGLQVHGLLQLEAGPTSKVAGQIKDLCDKLLIKPDALAVDRTGNGQGVYDMLKDIWSPEVIGVNYMEGASETKILLEDSKTCKEEYDRACSELWFALRKWMEFQGIMFSPQIDFSKLAEQMTTRQFAPGKMSRVESKKDFKSRNGGNSPDDADAMTLLNHASRKKSGSILSMNLKSGTNALADDYNKDDSKPRNSLGNRLTDDID